MHPFNICFLQAFSDCSAVNTVQERSLHIAMYIDGDFWTIFIKLQTFFLRLTRPFNSCLLPMGGCYIYKALLVRIDIKNDALKRT